MTVFRPWLVIALCFASVGAWAVPIKPDLQKILKQQEQRPRHYEPARAGWDGPEMVRAQDASPNPIYEAYGPASTVRAIRAALVAAVMPDPMAIGAIGLLILLLRYARTRRTRREQAALVIGPKAQEEQRAA